MKIKRISRAAFFCKNFAYAAGLNPLLKRLISIDQTAALRYIVTSRHHLWKLFQFLDNRNNNSPINNSELLALMNELFFGEESYLSQSYCECSKEFNEIVSIIQNTCVAYILEKVEIPKRKRQKVIDSLGKGFEVVNLVYGSNDVGIIEKENKRLFNYFVSEFSVPNEIPESYNKNTEVVDGTENCTQDETENQSLATVQDTAEQNNQSEDLVLLTRQETADIFGITLPTLAVWEKNGSIPEAKRIGSRMYFLKSEIMEHLSPKEEK